jgi:hypothetical protein
MGIIRVMVFLDTTPDYLRIIQKAIRNRKYLSELVFDKSFGYFSGLDLERVY